jgi:cysteine synthase B
MSGTIMSGTMNFESAGVEPSGPPFPSSRLGQALLDRIGNTPALRFDRLTENLAGVTLLGKAEWHNPGGSVKDRAAANIVAEGRRSGRFAAHQVLLDATSGNTGIAFAMLGAAEGFAVTLCMPTNVSRERKKILAAYGANIVYTDPGEGSDGAIRRARELAAQDPHRYFYADQYSNDKPRGASPTSWPCWAPAGPLSEPPGVCAN